MIDRISGISQQKAARTAGLAYLIITVLGVFAYFFVLSNLIVPGNATGTANNITANEMLFRLAIAAFVIMIICDVVVAWGLYIVLNPFNRSLSLLAAVFRLVYSTIHGIALLNLIIALQLLVGGNQLRAFGPDQLNSLALEFLNAHNFGFLIGLVFFGVHLALLGYLLFKSGYVPKIIGVLLLVAALAYIIDSFANFLLSNYADYETFFLVMVAVPAIIAELSLALWLLIKGVRVPATVR